MSYSFGGEQQQQIESLDALYRGFVLAMLMIFALLAIPLHSYSKPFIIMAIIPFGLIGVILGHLILGISMSAASFMGFFGLSGVVVNDSLVMIDFIEQRQKEGASARTAIIEGAKGRFRPIMLTSVTTFLGFTPLILETAIQAQFLVPFAASLGIGVLLTTMLLMVLIPALMAIYLRVNSRRGARVEFAPDRRWGGGEAVGSTDGVAYGPRLSQRRSWRFNIVVRSGRPEHARSKPKTLMSRNVAKRAAQALHAGSP